MLTFMQVILATVNPPQQVAQKGSKHFGQNLHHRQETKAQEADVEALHEVVQGAEAGECFC